MRFLRRRFILRVFSLCSLIVFANSIFYPSISYALTSGQFQPEYTSYEDASATDMVNLLTGDFNFNLPILSVPVGNQGNFTVPISYHANIGSEQEASWVGLGWNINCGSLTRNINAFPDDANMETQTISVKDLTGERGWYSSTLMGTYGWDSHAGKYGSVSLGGASLNYDENSTTVGFFGFSIGKDFGFDPVGFISSVVRVISDIVSEGAAEVGYSAMDVATGITMNAMQTVNFSPPQSPNFNGYWEYNSHKDPKLLGAYTNYWYWLDKSRTEEMYGTLYLDKVKPVAYTSSALISPVIVKINDVAQTPMQFPQSSNDNGKGAASDINIDLSNADYFANASPAILAYDNFYVSGPGASGSIRPYRMEIGSVSVPREMTKNHIRLSAVPFLDYGSNKVPFVFEGSQGNSYINHLGNSSGTVTSTAFNFGLSTSGVADCSIRSIHHNLNDVILSPSQRLGSGLTARKKLQQGQYVDWLTNAEIKATTGKFLNTSFMDCFPASYRANFRKNYLFGGPKVYYGTGVTNNVSNGTSTITLEQSLTTDDAQALNNMGNVTITVEIDDLLQDENGNSYYNQLTTYQVHVTSASGNQLTVDNPSVTMASLITITASISVKPDNAIGGFVVTSAEGMNYHYALPIYDYDFKSKSADKTDPQNKYSTYKRPAPFANTWLLTAITGPDFVDRGGSNGDGDGYIDENDWGYWVKFNYGNHSMNYQWRFPYSINGINNTTSDSQDKFDSYSEGSKEKYYLNSIETRSHVALFLKGDRTDAKSAVLAGHSMRLCEIALLTKDAYNQLTDPAGTLKLANASGTKDVLYQYPVAGNNTSSIITPAMETFIQANALRRVLFNKGKTTSSDDYTLCKGAANSDSNSGKLTLNSISFLGRNNFKTMPDYKFSYANNPNYDPNKWDGWGMYSSIGTAGGKTHKASTSSLDASAWSLTSIKSPLGHSVDIIYDRDTYSSISGLNIYSPVTTYNSSYSRAANIFNELPLSSPDQFQVGDKVFINGVISYACPQTPDDILFSAYSGEYSVQAKNSTSIFLNADYFSFNCPGGIPKTSLISVTNSGSISKAIVKAGGNLRVGSITLNDNLGGQMKTRYIYDGDNGISSGVVAVEPDYIRTSDDDYPFYKWPGYAATPVMYSKVTVLTGNLSSDTDYDTKKVYSFETPNQNQYLIHDSAKMINQQRVNACLIGALFTYSDLISVYRYEIEKRTSKIGKIKSIYVYDNAGTQVSAQNFVYTETMLNNGQNNYQGIFSEGTLLHELVLNQSSLNIDYYHKAQRTTVLNYPYVLQKVTTSNVDGQTAEKTNTNWDFITGGVIEQQDKSPLGLRTKTVYQPVYTAGGNEYNKFGSKALDPTYKNMLTQVAATYQYRIDDQGHELGLIGASATTWKKDMSNYRVLQSGAFLNTSDLYDLDNNGTITQTEKDAQQVWRKWESYTWLGGNARVNVYNLQSFGNADKFNFSSGVNPLWKKTGSIERFDHNSQSLETKDMNGLYSAVKFGYNNTLPLLSASNAAYEEVGYSGAEDRLSATSAYFGGEVALGSGTVVNTPVHTGSSALALSAGSGKGFVFKSSSIVAGKNYRASVWTSNSTMGQLYYNDRTEHTPAPTISQPITLPLPNGSTWYRIDILIPATTTSIEVGVKTGTGATGTIYFDDFKFQPVDAAVTCNVYNKNTFNLEYVLDNNNVYTRYEYNDGGILIKTYIESLKPGLIGEKLVSETRYDYKRLHVDK